MCGPTVRSMRNRIRTHNPKFSAEHLFYRALAIMHSSAYRDDGCYVVSLKKWLSYRERKVLRREVRPEEARV